jgi:hypothetical protein
MRRRGVVVAAALAVAIASMPVVAHGRQPADIGSGGPVGGPAQGGVSATRIPQPADVVAVSEYGAMRATTVDQVERVAWSLGVPAARARSYAVGVTTVWRGDTVVQQATRGTGRWQFPVVVTALPAEALGPIMGFEVSAAVGGGTIVLSTTGAALRTAQVGDVIELVRPDGFAARYTVGLVAPDAAVGGAEVVMSSAQADVLGLGSTTRVLVFGRFGRDQLDAALAAAGLTDAAGVRVSHSWAPASPDGTLGLARTKSLLGEFAYRINRDNGLTLDPAWVDANIVRTNFASVGIRASCHRAVTADIQAALDEIAELGLTSLIDVVDTNRYGGCWNPRYARASTTVGAVSRHAWGMALDLNLSTNPQGSRPRLDCRIVRIFRKHGFAWGGNFGLPDGMHFEWVGEARHTWQYPSTYCPNLPGGAVSAAAAPTARDTMFAD